MINTIATSNALTGIASYFVENNLLDLKTILFATQQAQRSNITLIRFLSTHQLMTNTAITEVCASYFSLPILNILDYNKHQLTHIQDVGLIRRYRFIPLAKHDNLLQIAIADPTDQATLDAITFHTGMRIKLALVTEDQLNNFIQTHAHPAFANEFLGKKELQKTEIRHVRESTTHYDEPLIKFVDNLIQDALQKNASDIHIEPFEKQCRIRYRQDGILYEITEIADNLAIRLCTRLKVMAKLDITERRLPQDGRFQLQQPTIMVDIRISTCPTLFGEKIVLRLLDTHKLSLTIDKLGLLPTQQKLFLEKISAPQGMILVTGPTGCGKTMTLYAALHHLNSSTKNISTAEDPVEIQLAGLSQININTKIGLDFATALRTLLRQDPDIIMIGEIRDKETADIAIQAAQTGHMVLSTLHTNSALETITRLQAIGIISYNLLQVLSLIMAQRLVRQLCPLCKKPDVLNDKFRQKIGLTKNIAIYKAHGCQYCLHGYQGRIGIYELLPLTPDLIDLIITGAPSSILIEKLVQNGFINLYNAGMEKVIQGITSLDEIERVIGK